MKSPLPQSPRSPAKPAGVSRGQIAGPPPAPAPRRTSFSSSMARTSKNPRAEHRQRERKRIEDSAKLAEKYPALTSLTANLEFTDALAKVKRASIKYRANLEHAKSVLVFACPNPDCIGGDFDLTADLARAIASHLKVLTGEVRCLGSCKTAAKGTISCRSLLRYTVTFGYLAPALKKRRYVRAQ